MSTFYYDPDEWETEVATAGSGINTWASYGKRRRSPEDIARIKAQKRRAREDAILAEADAIRASRASTGEEQ